MITSLMKWKSYIGKCSKVQDWKSLSKSLYNNQCYWFADNTTYKSLLGEQNNNIIITGIGYRAKML